MSDFFWQVFTSLMGYFLLTLGLFASRKKEGSPLWQLGFAFWVFATCIVLMVGVVAAMFLLPFHPHP